MNMTSILLTIIAVLLVARFILQVIQGKRAMSKLYSTTSEVRKVVVAGNSIEDLRDKLCGKWWYCSYELVAIIEDEGIFYAFLQSRKIQNYYDN